MKIRNGFVSNSSSSSFYIYGYVPSYDEQEAIIERAKNIKKEEIKEASEIHEESIDVDDEYFSFDDAIYIIEQSLGEDDEKRLYVKTEYGSDDETIFIGVDIDNQDLDETLREFHNRVEEAVKRLIGKEIKGNFSSYSEVISG